MAFTQELFAQHETSGLSAVVFCQQHGLCSRYFSLRRKQLTKVVEKVETGFARVHIKPNVKRDVSSRVASSLIIHSNASRLDFDVLPPAPWLAELLRALA